MKKLEHVLKLFARFAREKGVITYGMELMLTIFSIIQRTMVTSVQAAGFGTLRNTALPQEMMGL